MVKWFRSYENLEKASKSLIELSVMTKQQKKIIFHS